MDYQMSVRISNNSNRKENRNKNIVIDPVKYFTLFFITMFMLTSFSLFSQEICDDGIDNDGDGLTDCADPDCLGVTGCEGAFACDEGLYQVLSGQLNIFDPASLSYTPIGPNNPSYNGAGYNIEDGFMYGQINQDGKRYIWKIKNDGTYEVMGEVINGSNFPNYKADFDRSGNLMTYEAGVLYYVDVSATPPYNYTTKNVTNLTNTSWPSANDIVYNYIHDGYYLLTSSNELWMIDETAQTIQRVADLSTEFSTSSGGYGAAWSDQDGRLYFFNNSTGNIYEVELDASGTSVVTAGFLVAGTSNGNNDGMSCPLARLSEICGNGRDDDGDGLVDCDDPDCVESLDCGYTPPSGGEDSGLESNDRLARKIAKRNFNRTKNNTDNIRIDVPERKLERNAFQGRNGELESFIPIDPIHDSETYISTPEDLIGITNATEVFSVDYFSGGVRLGAILATESEGGVYEHTKYICDRLQGTMLENVMSYALDGENPFIISKFLKPNGIREYSTTFAFFRNGQGKFEIESHWNLVDYSEAETMYTFQVWAGNVADLEIMVQKVLESIAYEGEIQSYVFGEKPNLFVTHISYENQVLTFDIINNSESEELNIVGNRLATETAQGTTVSYDFPLTGEENQQFQIPTTGVYAIGLTLYHEQQTVSDGVYVADGVWGIDDSADGTQINNFEISQGGSYLIEEGLHLERDVEMNGMMKEYVSVYRSLNSTFKPENIGEFSTLSFAAKGSGELEVTVVRAGMNDWANQMRTTVYLSPELQQFDIPFSNFISETGENSWSDITMLVFAIKGNGIQSEAFELGIRNVQFHNGNATTSVAGLEFSGHEVKVFPNPMSRFTTVSWEEENAGSYTLELFNAQGKSVYATQGESSSGMNMIHVMNKNYPSGIYFFEIRSENGGSGRGRVIIQ